MPPPPFGPMMLNVLPAFTYKRSAELPDTPFPRSPAPHKVNVLFVLVEVSFRIENVPLVARTSKDPTVSVLAVSVRIPVEAPLGKTASSLTIGT